MAKFTITVFYNILLTYTGEIYPTEIRTQAYGLFMVSGRLALLTMQFVFSIWTYYSGLLPMTLIGSALFVSAILVYFLRESQDADMFESEEAEKKKISTTKPSPVKEIERPIMADDQY